MYKGRSATTLNHLPNIVQGYHQNVFKLVSLLTNSEMLYKYKCFYEVILKVYKHPLHPRGS